MSDFDKEMAKILNSSMNDYDKVKEYHKILQRKLSVENSNLPWMQAKEEEEEDEEPYEFPKPVEDYSSIILNSVPVPMKKQASTLLQIIQRQPENMKWNNKGEIYVQGKIIPHSNLADLFNVIFSNRKSINVVGKEEFLKMLQEMNIPKYYIKNKNLLSHSEKVVTPKRKRKYPVKWSSFK